MNGSLPPPRNAWPIGKTSKCVELTNDWLDWRECCAVQRLWREAGIRTVCREPGVTALGTECGAGEGWAGEEESRDIQAVHSIQD